MRACSLPGRCAWACRSACKPAARSVPRLRQSSPQDPPGREKDIQNELSKITPVIVSKELSYLEGVDLDGYLHDMHIAQEFARLNREAMLDVIIKKMNIKRNHIIDKWCTIHNYIDIKNGILRKGAISLQKDEMAIIPMNMKDGSLIVRGKGNEEWNFSGPHGAGRLMSRS